MTIYYLFLHTKKLAWKNSEIAFYPHYFLSVLNSSSYFVALSGYMTRSRRAHDRSVVEKIHTTPLDKTKNFYTV